MFGIPADINRDLVRILSSCEQFKDNRALEALFVDERLAAWRDSVPADRTTSGRVHALIDYLEPLYNRRHENILVLFLDVLKEKFHPEDARYKELNELSTRLGRLTALSPTSTHATPSNFGSDEDLVGMHFLRNLDFETVKSINVFCHTGESMVKELLNYFENSDPQLENKLKDIQVRILIRNPQAEVSSRADHIRLTVRRIMHLKRRRGFGKLQYHFYQALPIFRGLVCQHKDGSWGTAFIGFYHFPFERTSKRLNYVFPIRNKPVSGESALITLFNSWFEHYWGKEKKSIQQIYGIIFDFDDTIVDSHAAQIEVWVDVAQQVRDKYQLPLENFSESIRNDLDDRTKLRSVIREMFFRLQNGHKILDELFPGITTELAEEIQRWRFGLREKRTYAEVELFDGVEKAINDIADKYHLAIVSATDENMIERYFDSPGCVELLHHFQYVFGKQEPIFDWESVDRKSQLILKIIEVLGVPIERLVYVGDNHGDFSACKRIGIDFIEARLFERELRDSIKRHSLIESDEDRLFFTRWSKFSEVLAQVEAAKRGRD